MSIIDNYNRIREDIGRIAVSGGRTPDDIRIISVSKTFGSEIIQEAISAGIRIFGENKVQEAKKKIPLLAGEFSFHMVGHLQTNKAHDAVRLFDLIHSIDRIDTAEKVNQEAGRIGKKQKILVQVNASGEASKSGIAPEASPGLIEGILKLEHIELLGLMTMAPFTDEEDPVRGAFRETKRLLDEINASLGIDLRELSMGMSSDYRIAVEEGATLVRIGTAIFGSRISE